MPTLREIDVHIDDVMESLTDEQIRAEYLRRFKEDPPVSEATDDQITCVAQDRMLFPEETSIDDFTDTEIENEFRERRARDHMLPSQVVDELYRTHAEVPQIVKDWLYQETGRTLP